LVFSTVNEPVEFRLRSEAEKCHGESTMALRFLPPPRLPPWLEEQLPFNRRVFADGDHTIHFIDEGEGAPVLLLHGNPTWSYLWRKVIRVLPRDKVRIIAPDLVGLGLSSKPPDLKTHTLDFHANRISTLVEALDLQRIAIAAQDWGGPIIAVMAARNRERIRGAVFSNTAIRVSNRPPRRTAFHRFAHMPLVSDLAFRVFNFPVPTLHLAQGDRSSIGRNERRAYRWPLRRIKDRVAPLALARLVAQSQALQTLQEADDWARSFKGPVRLVWGMRDRILGRALKGCKELFPDAEVVETNAGHFLQEEVPEALAEGILSLVSG
jgi:pimeloyl-ACP methyl ester carboxylesterase